MRGAAQAHAAALGQVAIVTPDDTPEPPTEFLGYPISYTPGSRFSLYNSIVLSMDTKASACARPPLRRARAGPGGR